MTRRWWSACWIVASPLVVKVNVFDDGPAGVLTGTVFEAADSLGAVVSRHLVLVGAARLTVVST
jgi:hypothetical protein